MSKPHVLINKWSIAYGKLHGIACHPMLCPNDPDKVITTKILTADFNNNCVETQNTIYILGSIDPFYLSHLVRKDWWD